MSCHPGAGPGVSLQDANDTGMLNNSMKRLHMIQLVSDTMPHLEATRPLNPPPSDLQLTVDVVYETCRPWYVVHLGLLFICFVYLDVTSSHECFKICFFQEDDRKRLYTRLG